MLLGTRVPLCGTSRVLYGVTYIAVNTCVAIGNKGTIVARIK